MTDDYKRNGTAALFAVLDVLTEEALAKHAAPSAPGTHPLPRCSGTEDFGRQDRSVIFNNYAAHTRAKA